MRSLLLLHGALGSAAQWDALRPLLEGQYELHTLDLKGHGGTPLPDVLHMQGFADGVLDYLDRKGLDQVAVFGYSMGGYLALYLALKYPGRIGKIYTLATKFDWTPEASVLEAAKLNPEIIAEKVPAFARQLAARHHPQDWKQLLAKTAAMMLDLGKNAPLSQSALAQIPHVVKVAVGDLDKMVTIAETSKAALALPNGSFAVWEDTPHPFDKIATEILYREIAAFFD